MYKKPNKDKSKVQKKKHNITLNITIKYILPAQLSPSTQQEYKLPLNIINQA